MGACCSAVSGEDREDRKRSQKIEHWLQEEGRKFQRECKILLLGSGESGKSTIVKQMKIIHQNGYTKNELCLYRLTIYKNVIDCIKALIAALDEFGIEPADPKVNEMIEYIKQYNVSPDPNTPFDPTAAEAVDRIWHDEAVPKVLEHQSEFYLMDSAPYFFDEVARIAESDYIPTEADILRARTKTTGIYETRFTMGALSIHMFDVGGQRSERKKWIHCFENVTSIIFCVALSEYDQVLLEESAQNRMLESLNLFESVINSRWFMRTSIILFLNKVDLFEVKLARVPLSDYFPDYAGGNHVGHAATYLRWRFNRVNRASLDLYCHLTQATNTSNIRVVFLAVKETILQNALKESGMI